MIAAISCGPKTAQVDPALARLVPAGTVAVLDVKAGALRQTALYKEYVAGRFAESLRVTDDVTEALAVTDGKDAWVFTKSPSGLAQYDREGNKTVPRVGAGVPPALAVLLKTITPEHQVFGAGLGTALPSLDALPQQGNLANLAVMMKSLQSWTLAADLRYDLKLRVNATYQTEPDARRIHDALKGILGIARLSTPRDAPELLRLYDGVQVAQEKAVLRVAIDAGPDAIDKATERMKALAK